ncbi:MAG: hypothetical protein KC766_03235 [Myxococcales bacterium]|nr:hypothetical protein [Myxococcales bacterium]
MSDEQFEQLARRIVWVTLSAVGVSGCGGGEPPRTSAAPPGETTSIPVAEPPSTDPTASATPPSAPSEGEQMPQQTPQGERCRADGGVNVLAGLSPAKPVDYVAVFQSFGKGQAAREGEHLGTPCSGASDERQCDDALKAKTPESGFRVECRPGYCAHGVAYTRGNEVGLASSIDELKAFLGPLDTEGDAILMAWAEGYNIGTCADLEKNLKQTKDGYELVTEKMTADCPIEISEFKLKIATDGSVSVLSKKVKSKSGACVGRQSAGTDLRPIPASNVLGAYFTDCAQLERAAVFAFARMQEELRALGAPPSLVADAKRSARDEERHVAILDRLAQDFGGERVEPEVRDLGVRSAYDVALENAVEGCVRESYGALVGLWQSERAADAGVRDALREVAEDELRHAALSWRVAAWLEPRLTEQERLRVAQAQRAALVALHDECAVEPASELVETAGLPTAAQALGLLQRLGAAVGVS